MRKPFVLPILCILAPFTAGAAFGQTLAEPVPVRAGGVVTDFGFWPGEWLIENTRFDAENEVFVNGGVARSSAELLLDGRLLLERWEGEDGAIEAFCGLTLRYFDPGRGRWVALKNWPAGDPLAAQFTRTEGSFEDGRIVLHPPRVYLGNFDVEQYLSTRSVVGDVSGDAFRVQLQRPVNGQVWTATWAMDYLRESEAQVGPMRIDAVPETAASEAEQPRLTDWLVGEWSAEGVSVRVSSVLRGLGFVVSVEADRGDVRASAVLAAAWDARTESWQIREVGLNEPLRSLVWDVVGRVRDTGLVLRSKGTDDLGGMVFRRLQGGGMQFELTLPDGERLDVELTKR
ncbi:MAG: hypothetical protein AAFO89_10340 [Planctomycetota bacterium]